MSYDPIASDVKSVLEKLKWHKDQGHNVLTADISFENANGLYSPVIETVTLSSNPDDKDVYVSKEMLRVHTHGLEKLAVAANLVWDPTQSGPIQIISGQKCTFRAVGGLMKADGHIEYTAAYFEVDLPVIRDDLKAKYKNPKDAYKIDRDWRQKRQHMLPIAESMARARLIRKLLGMRQEYTREQLSKPFVLARWRMKIDMTDPETKRLVTTAMLGAMLGIYGPGKNGGGQNLAFPHSPSLLPQEAEIIEADTAARTEGRPTDDPFDAPLEPPAPADLEGRAPGNGRPDLIDIETLAQRKGVNTVHLPHPLEDYSAASLAKFKAKLEAMPDKADIEIEDDISF
ncbi:MAG: hypothetical protein ABIL58_23445 [Pseudomonadota bacterium]